jgi:hypothetical protein
MGILVTQDPNHCTHLAAPSLVRTQKFLCALACGATIVSTDFINECIATGELPSVEKFLLKDTQNEKRFQLKLKESIKRAKDNRRHLLHGVAVYCTEQIGNGPDTFKAVVEANGGMFYIYRGRGGAVIKPSNSDDEEEVEPVYLLSGLKPEEKRLWPKFEMMARDGNMEPRIVVTEWILDTAMSQSIKWNPVYLASNA